MVTRETRAISMKSWGGGNLPDFSRLTALKELPQRDTMHNNAEFNITPQAPPQ